MRCRRAGAVLPHPAFPAPPNLFCYELLRSLNIAPLHVWPNTHLKVCPHIWRDVRGVFLQTVVSRLQSKVAYPQVNALSFVNSICT